MLSTTTWTVKAVIWLLAFSNLTYTGIVDAAECSEFACCLDELCCGPGTSWDGEQCTLAAGNPLPPVPDFEDICYIPVCTEDGCCGEGTTLVVEVDNPAEDRCMCVGVTSCPTGNDDCCCTAGYDPTPVDSEYMNEDDGCGIGDDIAECEDDESTERRMLEADDGNKSWRRRLGEIKRWVKGTWKRKGTQRQTQTKGRLTGLFQCRHRDRECTQNYKGEFEIVVTFDDDSGKVTGIKPTGKTRNEVKVGGLGCGPWGPWSEWKDCMLA